MPDKSSSVMDEFLVKNPPKQLRTGDTIDGTIYSVQNHEVWVDLGPHGIGVVIPREITRGQNYEKGQQVTVSIVDPELDEGYPLLSTRRAAKEKGWDELEKIFEKQEIIEVQPFDANRGGLLVEMEGVKGFLPVSQLSAAHYPRVSGADKDEILQKLGELVGKTLRARILDVSRKDNKLIFSEKEAIR